MEKLVLGNRKKSRPICFLFENFKRINQGDKNDETNESIIGG